MDDDLPGGDPPGGDPPGDDVPDGATAFLRDMRARCIGLPEDVSPGGLTRMAPRRLSVAAARASATPGG
ncbi:hypothetical protein QZM22_14590 [Burkholderia oklahomensis]|uniref:hypothetical protein n=1 Tax=Burkholderia oklahomensis TaxID=342113 RepID=UPI002656A329|nr:hypothetical protein [Burkholderia oklahomensis]MDN7673709.1 hypothetical protein [Burkholderia oklahomensis]